MREERCGLTVMKAYAGGRLFKAEASPSVWFHSLCSSHYALTKPAVVAVMAGFDEPKHVLEAVHYESATDEEKDYASVLAKVSPHGFQRSVHLLRPLQAMSCRDRHCHGEQAL